MAEPITAIKYVGTTLPADADTEVLFDGGELSPGQLLETAQRTYGLSLDHSETGTVRGFWSDDDFVTETEFYNSGVIAAPALTTEIRVNISGKKSVRFDWLNGGVTQGTFAIQQWLSTEVQP